jgi:hypothetical protein
MLEKLNFLDMLRNNSEINLVLPVSVADIQWLERLNKMERCIYAALKARKKTGCF